MPRGAIHDRLLARRASAPFGGRPILLGPIAHGATRHDVARQMAPAATQRDNVIRFDRRPSPPECGPSPLRTEADPRAGRTPSESSRRTCSTCARSAWRVLPCLGTADGTTSRSGRGPRCRRRNTRRLGLASVSPPYVRGAPHSGALAPRCDGGRRTPVREPAFAADGTRRLRRTWLAAPDERCPRRSSHISSSEHFSSTWHPPVRAARTWTGGP